MNDLSSLQTARARARLRHMAPAPVKPRIRVMAGIAPPRDEPPPQEAATTVLLPIAHEDDDAPFDPPSHDDFVAMGAWDEEADEDAIFAPEQDAAQFEWKAPVEDALTDFAPEPVELQPEEAEPEPLAEEEAPSPARIAFEQDAIALIAAQAASAAPSPEAPPAPRSPDPIYDQAVPPIAIYGSWDRQEIATLLTDFASDRRIARATVTLERGGLDAALIHFATHPAPDLVILDSTLRARELLAGVDKLVATIGAKAKIFVVGAINDIALLRELTARGVKYVVPPIRQDDLARAVCGLYAQADSSRVIAVMGARGGVGASTIAHNLAWSIAERYGADTTLIDLDLAFGAAAFNVQRPATQTLADIAEADPRDIAAIERASVHHTPRLQILAAPTDLGADFELDAPALEALLARARRAASFVVLDLPHAWHGWVRRALELADDVVIVASPDLASLRNADNMLRCMKDQRAEAPLIIMSMIGVPKRPEISSKEFTQALGQAPAASFAYEPALFGAAAFAGQMLGESAPRAKAAQTIDTLAGALTGLAPIKTKKTVQTLRAAEHAIAAAAQRAKTAEETPFEQSEEAPPPLELTPIEDAYLAQARAATANSNAPPAEQTPGRGRPSLLRVAAYVAAIAFVTSLSRGVADTDAAAEASAASVSSTAMGDPVARTREAWALLSQGQEADAIAMLRPIGERGYAPAQYLLAKAYRHGPAADLALARQWTERAARTGHARAMHDLGVFYASGEGAPRDDEAAFRWFRQAAEFNVADSQYNLAVMYQEGRGVAANPAEALRWYLIAARRDDQAAAARAATLQAQLPPEQARHAQARAEAFQPRAPRAD